VVSCLGQDGFFQQTKTQTETINNFSQFLIFNTAYTVIRAVQMKKLLLNTCTSTFEHFSLLYILGLDPDAGVVSTFLSGAAKNYASPKSLC
jgi:hypothetical protein